MPQCEERKKKSSHSNLKWHAIQPTNCSVDRRCRAIKWHCNAWIEPPSVVDCVNHIRWICARSIFARRSTSHDNWPCNDARLSRRSRHNDKQQWQTSYHRHRRTREDARHFRGWKMLIPMHSFRVASRWSFRIRISCAVECTRRKNMEIDRCMPFWMHFKLEFTVGEQWSVPTVRYCCLAMQVTAFTMW